MLKYAMSLHQIILFFNCFQFYFIVGRLATHYTISYLTTNRTVKTGKYVYYNGYVDFFAKLTKKGFEKKCCMHFIQDVFLMLWPTNVLMHEIFS